jgi:hypothetical protein
VTRRDPFAELGLPPDASPSAVKAAWRRLAREHHPDLARDRAEERAATRRMARINAAYAVALRLAEDRRSGRGPGTTAGASGGPGGRGRRGPAGGTGPGGTGSQRPGTAGAGTAGDEGDAAAGRPGYGRARLVTRRVDTSATFHAAGARGGGGSGLLGQAPRPADRPGRESLRGAPGGPVERHRPTRPPAHRLPDLEAARTHVLPFGKFHDRTLGEVERVEPTYIDWIVRTIRRDPELVAAARVVQGALDAAGVQRKARPDRSPDHIGAGGDV